MLVRSLITRELGEMNPFLIKRLVYWFNWLLANYFLRTGTVGRSFTADLSSLSYMMLPSTRSMSEIGTVTSFFPQR